MPSLLRLLCLSALGCLPVACGSGPGTLATRPPADAGGSGESLQARQPATVAEPAATGAIDPGGALDLQPFVVHKTSSMVRIAWRTDGRRASSIRFGRTLDLAGGVVETPEGRMHVADLTGLLAGTRYHYRVENAATGSFVTPPDEPVRTFAVLSHTHGSESFDHYPDELLVAEIANVRPDFVLHTGDVTYYSRYRDFKRYYFDLFEGLLASTPVYIAPGNHDSGFPFVEDAGLRPFKELFPYPYAGSEADACYAVEQGNLRVLVLSYLSPLGPGSAQRRWLGERLAEKGWDFQAVAFGGSHEMFYDRRSLLDFLVAQGADLAFCGDGTQPKEYASEHQGLPLFYVGSRDAQPSAFLYCRVSEGNLSIQQIFADGKAGPSHHLFTRRRHEPVLTVTPKRVVAESRVVGYEAVMPEPLDSARVRGLQLDVEVAPGKVAVFGVIAVPADRQLDDPMGGYPNEQMPRIREGSHLVTMRLPNRTAAGEPFSIRRLKLVFLSVGPEDLSIGDLRLY